MLFLFLFLSLFFIIDSSNPSNYTKARIFIGLIDQLNNLGHIKNGSYFEYECTQYFQNKYGSCNRNAKVLRTTKVSKLMSRILGDCQLWNLNDINVAIADEYGIYFSANLHDYKTPEALIATFGRRDNYKPKILSSSSKSYMAEDFLRFFAQENDPSVLNIAYIITDHMFDWKYSRFLTWLKKSQSKVADFINLKQIYTKFIVYLYTKPLVFRNTTHLMTIHQDASYYFEQIYFIESPIDVFYQSKRTYSICDELKNNQYECSCCTEKDLASLKQTLLNLIQNCEGEDNAILTLFSLGERNKYGKLNHFKCQIEMDGCQKLINQLKINDITYRINEKDRNLNKSVNSVKTFLRQEMMYSLTDSFVSFLQEDTKAAYIITNYAQDYSDVIYLQMRLLSVDSNEEFIDTFMREGIFYGIAIFLKQYSIVYVGEPTEELKLFQQYEKIMKDLGKWYILSSNQSLEDLSDELSMCMNSKHRVSEFHTSTNKNVILLFSVTSVIGIVAVAIWKYRKARLPWNVISREKYTRPSTYESSSTRITQYDWKNIQNRSESENRLEMLSTSNNMEVVPLQRLPDITKILRGMLLDGGIIADKLCFDSQNEYPFNMADLEYRGIVELTRNFVKIYAQKLSNKLMAVKFLHIPRIPFEELDSSRDIKKLVEEIIILKRISNCPNVVDFYGVCFFQGEILISMELMDLSLERLITIIHRNKRAFSEKLVGLVAVSIINALLYCKSINVIHRDVKPSNILVHRRGEIKLCDFGESRFLEYSRVSSRAGTIAYWPPENFMVEAEYFDNRSDVWSLGITLLEAIFGHLPYLNERKANLHHDYNYLSNKIIRTNFGRVIDRLVSQSYSLQLKNFLKNCLNSLDKRPKVEHLSKEQFYLAHREMCTKENIEQQLQQFVNFANVGY